jgi:hypothetical protein
MARIQEPSHARSPKPTPLSIDRAKQIVRRAGQKTDAVLNTPIRRIARNVHEAAREQARRISSTEQYQRSRRERKKVGTLFAHLKRILKLNRLRLRGLSGASDEFTLAAVAQNLRRLANLAPQTPPFAGIRLAT